MRKIITTVTVVLCYSLGIQALQPDTSKPKALIQEVKMDDDVKKLLYPAIIEAKVNTTVTADLDGHVRKILKSLGSPVKAGEVVLTLVNNDPAFTYSEVPVRSPISGVLALVHFQFMSKVTKGDKLFTVMDAQSKKIQIELPSSEVGRLQSGTKGTFRFNGIATENFPIQVVGISPVVDPRSGTASAEAEFLPLPTTTAKNTPFPPIGTVGQASFQLITGKVILLPENSVSYLEGKATVRIIDANNRSHRRIVELGEQREDLFVIKTGVSHGEKVVLRSSRSLKEDEEVETENKAQN